MFKVKYSYWMVYAPDKETARKKAIAEVRKNVEEIVSVEKFKKKQPPLWRMLLFGK